MSPDQRPLNEPNPPLAEFGARLRHRRDELGVSQETVAARIGVHWTGLSRIERGIQEPKLTMILRLARGLDTTPGALLDGLGGEETSTQQPE